MIEQLTQHFEQLHQALQAEEEDQRNAYSLDNPESLKQLKANGLAIHPMKISNRTYGFLDYPELKLTAPFPAESRDFKPGGSVELICPGETSVKGTLIEKNDKVFVVRLFAGDFPDWLDDGSIGLKVAPDSRTLEIMTKALELVPSWTSDFEKQSPETCSIQKWHNEDLNDSQKAAVTEITGATKLQIVHGPPGTGKTTTIVEAITQMTSNGQKVLVAAPSNAAVDLIAEKISTNINALRVGNNAKVPDHLMHLTVEGKSKESGNEKTIKRLRIQAEELRKMAHQYKRNFGRDERNQRKLLFQEVANIRKEIKAIRAANEEKLVEKAQVVLGTPVGLFDQAFDYTSFDCLIIDEASQCMEPLAWAIIPLAKKVILAGDPFQLPPTVLSRKADKLGLGISILERWNSTSIPSTLLNIQYRMCPELMAFSNAYFYQNKLQSAKPKQKYALNFYDTVGTETAETHLDGHHSLANPVEADYIVQLIEQKQLSPKNTRVISPYSGQVAHLKKRLGNSWKVATIDSFQGQEAENIVLSLVRSNDSQDIGFLKDYRRMNVALTRAQTNLFVFGDSSTLSSDKFYAEFLDEVERQNAYHSCWELT